MRELLDKPTRRLSAGGEEADMKLCLNMSFRLRVEAQLMSLIFSTSCWPHTHFNGAATKRPRRRQKAIWIQSNWGQFVNWKLPGCNCMATGCGVSFLAIDSRSPAVLNALHNLWEKATWSFATTCIWNTFTLNIRVIQVFRYE